MYILTFLLDEALVKTYQSLRMGERGSPEKEARCSLNMFVFSKR